MSYAANIYPKMNCGGCKMSGYIEVLQGGILTTVQDLGRYGYQKFGIPVSGVMDTESYMLANKLTGNDNNEAVLEMTVFGGSYKFTDKTIFALTGANMNPTLNGGRIRNYKTYYSEAGDILSLGSAKTGCRCYLAVAGGIDVPPEMNSRSTYRPCGIGGFKGRELRKGDILPIGNNCNEIEFGEYTVQKYNSKVTVRVIPGPQDDLFTVAGAEEFYSSEYTVSKLSDRMGIRLDGPAVESINGTDIISDATVFGSIQITNAGKPVILMADRQTTGGYAKIATVVSDDLPLLAQAMPGDRIRFIRI